MAQSNKIWQIHAISGIYAAGLVKLMRYSGISISIFS